MLLNAILKMRQPQHIMFQSNQNQKGFTCGYMAKGKGVLCVNVLYVSGKKKTHFLKLFESLNADIKT